ncbi:arginase [uncultured Marivita sp.]|uniref:arginase n=1 Tax=uncultured Marivita sp. TaxID=888080 RepID=UPI002608B4AC|nr:arginase [uncultured Marivita sp.]
MQSQDIVLVGAPLDCGKARKGCLMGPDAYRTAGIARALTDLGHRVHDLGNVAPDANDVAERDGLVNLSETIGWTTALIRTAHEAIQQGLPIFLGGDHALSLGTVPGVAAHAAQEGRPQFVLWLDAHSDFNTLVSTPSGNLHGTPLAYATGQTGFDGFPPLPAAVPTGNTCIIGLRSVDLPERALMEKTDVRGYDMRAIDESGVAALLMPFLEDVAKAGGALHVSLDVDFIDPTHAPAVGTTVPGGATVREAHLVMEMLCDSGLMTSLDLVELNPMLDERGRTAHLMVDLAASALGRRIFDRPTPRLM